MTARAGTCRSCGAPILWATTENGKAMPLDPETSERGNVEFTGTRDIVRVVAGPFHPSIERHTSHYASCPQASEWRRKR